MTSAAQLLNLSDGRVLDVRIVGADDASAPTLVYHHGTPSSGRVPAAVVTAAVAEMESLLPPVDREFLGPGFGDDLAASFREAVATSADGWVDDDLAFTRAWGFDLASITVPIAIWQGSEDLMVPFAHGTWLATAMPQARAHLVQGEGHLSVVVGAIDQILDDLLANQHGA